MRQLKPGDLVTWSDTHCWGRVLDPHCVSINPDCSGDPRILVEITGSDWLFVQPGPCLFPPGVLTFITSLELLALAIMK